MTIKDNRIEYQKVKCWACEGTGIVKDFIKCPNNLKKMHGKKCAHCGTRNHWHDSIPNGMTYCRTCQGARSVMENNCSWMDKDIIKTIADQMDFRMLNDKEHYEKCESMDGEGGFIVGMFEQLFGCTDYIDHRKDTPEQLKTLIYRHITDGGQAIHFLNNDGSFKKTCLMVGYNGGYHGKLV